MKNNQTKRGLRRQLPLLSEKEVEQMNSWLKTDDAKEFFKSCEKAGKLFKRNKECIER